tara:strand:+ start:481 stop:969 length:489 start_codon:yes stop_codon:yes gene_type:complete
MHAGDLRRESNDRARKRVERATRAHTPAGGGASQPVALRKSEVTPGTALISPFQRAGLFSPPPVPPSTNAVKQAKGSQTTSPMPMSAPPPQRAGGRPSTGVTGRKRKKHSETSGAATAAPGIRARPAATPHEKIAVLEVEEEEVFRSVFERQMLGECYFFSC